MLPCARWRPVPALFLMIAFVLASAVLSACNPPLPPVPEAEAFRKEIRGTLIKLQKSLAPAMAKRDIAAIDKILTTLAGTVPGICLDCPYRSGVLDTSGVLLTTFPKTEIVGMNFSAYSRLMDTLQRQRITQRRVFLPDRSKMYFITAPLVFERQVVGAVVLGLTPADLERKWQLTEEAFLALDLNVH